MFAFEYLVNLSSPNYGEAVFDLSLKEQNLHIWASKPPAATWLVDFI